MKKLLVITCTLILAACTYHRFSSLKPCEFEARELFGTSLWSSTNCPGEEDKPSHLKQSMDEVTDAKE